VAEASSGGGGAGSGGGAGGGVHAQGVVVVWTEGVVLLVQALVNALSHIPQVTRLHISSILERLILVYFTTILLYFILFYYLFYYIFRR
jgi:uncharacterized spore protein YtfJ